MVHEPDPADTRGRRLLAAVAALSAVYDLVLGTAMLAGRAFLAALFAVPPPLPAIHADLNGLFLIAIGIGYVLPLRDPDRYRGYLWVMGPFLKGIGALAFVLDYFLRGSPAAYLLFAVSDGSLAGLTLWALWRTSPPRFTRQQAVTGERPGRAECRPG